MYDVAIELQQQGRLEEAVGKLHEILKQEETYALAHAALSVFYSRLQRHEEATAHARRVCELEPDDPFSFIALSLICQKAGRLEEAERAMLQARQTQYAQYLARQDEGSAPSE